MTPDERLSKLEQRMDALTKEVNLLRKDLEGAFYGSDHDPQKTQQMKRIGLLRKLDEFDDMASTLREIRDALMERGRPVQTGPRYTGQSR